MANQLLLKAACKVPYPEKLFEGYEMLEGRIAANVGVDKIESVMRHFIAMHDKQPLFFILELPCRWQDEEEIAQGEITALHSDVYYIDGCSREKALSILSRVGNVLFHDGLSLFGFGVHGMGEEIVFDRYNVLTIFTGHQEAYAGFFEAHGMEPVSGLVTAWNTFSMDHAGECELYEADGVTAYDLPEQLKDLGIYFAERRERA